MSSAARAGMRGTPARSSPTTRAKIASSTIRCSALRRPSRPRHRPEKNERGVMIASDLFLDPRGLAGQVAQVVELGAAHVAAPLDGDLADGRAVGLEHALDALAVRDLAHRERGVESAIAARDHDTLVRLHPLTVAFHHLDLHHHGIAGLEVRNLAGHALLLDFLDYLAHISHLDLRFRPHLRSGTHSMRAAPRARAARSPARRAGRAQTNPRRSNAHPPARRATAAPARR